MPDFNVRSDSVNVEQVMDQIRARIKEKRGVDYTEQEVRELAAVKLEKFLDPRGVRSDLLEQFRKREPGNSAEPLPNYEFNDQTLYEAHRGPIRWIRRLLNPILKLFFNPNPLIQALHIQSQLNTMTVGRDAARRGLVQLQYEVLHNLVVETTRLGIEVKNLKMRVESLVSRLEFNERRSRALESVVAYRPAAEDRSAPAPERIVRADEPAPSREPQQAPVSGGSQPQSPEGPGQRSRRRRRRRGRRGGGSAATVMGGAEAGAASAGTAPEPSPDTGSSVDSGTPEPSEPESFDDDDSS